MRPSCGKGSQVYSSLLLPMTIPIRSMPELLQAFRNRRDELNISHETIDTIAGLQSGYASKLLAPKPIKNLGPMSFESILGALGLAIVVVDDPSAAAKVSKHWVKRKRPQRLAPASMAASITNEVPAEIQVTPELQAKLDNHEHMKRIAKMGAKRRNKVMKKRARQRAASHAARIRWSKREPSHA
jgi:hypothetical protein